MATVLPRRATVALALPAMLVLGARPGARQAVIQLDPQLVPNGQVISAATGLRYAVYLADQEVDEVRELYSVALDPPFTRQKLNGPLVANGDVDFFLQISPDGGRVVYRGDQDADEVFELFSVPITGDSSPVQLNGTLASGGDVGTRFQITPDSTRVVYLADQDADEVVELFSVPILGGTPVQLNAALAAGGDVLEFEISPDSTRVAYVADQDVNDRGELYSAPVDGSAPPTKLNAPLVAGGAVFSLSWSWAISPDSSRVVYRAEQDVDGLVELYSVPIDGSAAPVQLNGPLFALGDVWTSSISPDSSRVVYVADQDTDEVYELYGAPIDGSASAVKLNGPMVLGGDVAVSFTLLSPDSTRVVYTADQDTNGVSELYRAPIDGSAPAVKLHPPLPPGRSVNAAMVRVSADSSRVIYISNADSPLVFELFSVPLDASGPPVKLNPPLVPGGNVSDFALDPQGGRVAYRADASVDERLELFTVSIGGSGATLRVNRDLAPGGALGFYWFTADGNRVLYGANQNLASQLDLFLRYLTPLYRRAR